MPLNTNILECGVCLSLVIGGSSGTPTKSSTKSSRRWKMIEHIAYMIIGGVIASICWSWVIIGFGKAFEENCKKCKSK